MPFTFCHPAIVLPLNRIKSLSLTGLIAGSVAPDFEYFIRMADKRVYTHTWSGVLWIDTPLALVLTFLFHNVVRNHLINNAPVSFQRRLKRYIDFNWFSYFKKRWPIVIICAVMGIYSHLIWDAFTHESGYFVQHLPFLLASVPVGSFRLEVPMLLQVLSSIFGALVIYFALWQLPVDTNTIINPNYLHFWKKVWLITILIFSIRFFFGVSYEIEDVVIPAFSAFLAALVVTSIFQEKQQTFIK